MGRSISSKIVPNLVTTEPITWRYECVSKESLRPKLGSQNNHHEIAMIKGRKKEFFNGRGNPKRGGERERRRRGKSRKRWL